MNRLYQIVQIALFTFFESLGVICLTLSSPVAFKLWIFLVAHCFASLFAARVLSLSMPKKWESLVFLKVGYLFAFLFFLPFLGMCILLFIVFFVYRLPQHEHEDDIKTVSLPVVMPSIHELSHRFSAGGAKIRLAQEGLSADERTEALMAIQASQSPEANHLIREALHDKDDQLRLLAFSILDQQEKSISDHINYLKDKLNESTVLHEKSRLQKYLAQCYWEMVYRNIVQGDMVKRVLNFCYQHAKAALETRMDDPALWSLLGKIYLKQNENEKARTAFYKAQSCGAPESQVFPYLANIAFDAQDFSLLKKLMKHMASAKDIPKLKPLIHFWCNGNDNHVT